LHDVDDAAAFTVAIASRAGLALDFHDREELKQFLLVECWRLSLKYDRGNPQYPTRFSVYATNILRRRVVDWQRQRLGRSKWTFSDGRSYERKPTVLVSLDADDSVRGRLVDALGTWSSDPAAGGDPDLGGMAATGDRQRAWDFRTLGLRPPRRERCRDVELRF
jgi:hypothetical protein